MFSPILRVFPSVALLYCPLFPVFSLGYFRISENGIHARKSKNGQAIMPARFGTRGETRAGFIVRFSVLDSLTARSRKSGEV